MSFDFKKLVTDRTEADVKRWEMLRDKGFVNMTETERAEWLAGDMKGAYNKGDLTEWVRLLIICGTGSQRRVIYHIKQILRQKQIGRLQAYQRQRI